MKRNQFLDPFQVSLSQGASKKGTGAAFWCCEDHFDASNAESMEDGTGLAWHSQIQLVAQALKVKIAIVEADPYEQSIRAHLNLGHTLGHALEVLSNYSMRHGEAVGIGMLAASHIAVAVGLAQESLIHLITLHLERWSLPTRIPAYPTSAILSAMRHDKKRSDNQLRWILPIEPGKVVIKTDV